ncbi:MAG: VWA domain-containing protein [Nitratireductor sp.]|uniref:vWA domain-containing protein n=1 Tax=Nitratireductor sp. TaxID=1872084 RepID=UPI00261BEC47|nr:VWA domain-containing protein [Nitratireductor sp.]MCV0349886.1 VWA domain-containing protein [Nitratireductor sp.]
MTGKTCFAQGLRRAMLGTALAVCIPMGALQAEAAEIDDAVEMVRMFFAEHSRRFNNNEEPLLNDGKASRRFLVDGLAHDDLQGALMFDPVYGGQDAQIANLNIAPDADAPILRGAAQIHVTFTNMGAPRNFIYTLIEAPDGAWQINDIYSEDDNWSLSELAQGQGFEIRSDLATEATLSGGGASGAGSGGDRRPEGAGADDRSSMVPGMEEGDLPGNGLAEGGSDLLFVLDGSGSMWGQIDGVAKITTARQVLSGLMGDLAANTNVGLMAYGHRREGDCGDTEIIYPVANYESGQLTPAIEGITPRGKTPIADALMRAADAMPQSGRPANVLLISDGLETCGGDPCAAAAALAERGINTRVHVVGFDLSDEENAALQCIADNGNGKYYSASNADEFARAVGEVVAEAERQMPEPKPAPQPEPVVQAVFEEKFDGPELDAAWQVVNPAENLTAFTGDGMLFTSVLGRYANHDDAKAQNRYVLDHALPEGDFDLALDFRIHEQTGYENVWLSVQGDAENQIGAMAWVWRKGCGAYLNLSLIRVSDGKEEARFDTNLFDGPIVARLCQDGDRAYGDRVLEALGTQGAELRLKRRGRQVTAAIAMELPEADGRPADTFRFETEPMTVLRLSGQPAVLAGHWHKARPGESHIAFDRFTIEAGSE